MISRETDYAFRIIRALSAYQRMSIQQICDQEYIPLAYAYKIIKKLERAHFVRIFRGAKGGYELSCDLDEKTFYDVYLAIEGDLFLNACQAGSVCPHRQAEKPCNVHLTLSEMRQEFIQIMKQRSLRNVI